MAHVDDDESITFNVEEVQKIVRDNIELCLGGNAYSHSRTPQWISIITDKTLARLNKLNKPFKYIYVFEENMKRGRGSTCCVGVDSAARLTQHPLTPENNYNPEEWLRSAYCSGVLLGHGDRRNVYGTLGK